MRGYIVKRSRSSAKNRHELILKLNKPYFAIQIDSSFPLKREELEKLDLTWRWLRDVSIEKFSIPECGPISSSNLLIDLKESIYFIMDKMVFDSRIYSALEGDWIIFIPNSEDRIKVLSNEEFNHKYYVSESVELSGALDG